MNLIQTAYSLKKYKFSKIKLNTLLFTQHKSIYNLKQLNPLTNQQKCIHLKTANLVKPLLWDTIGWSSGMLSNLMIYVESKLLQKKDFNNLRTEWVLWEFIYYSWFAPNPNYFVIYLSPWSIRIRRFFKYFEAPSKFVVIKYKSRPFYTPTRRIKRWLKKKYTTQSWR